MSEVERDVLVGQTLGGKYLVRRVIGVGGMGTVYEVEHELTKRTGALKLLHRHYAQVERVLRRFVREASAAGRIGSPHIVETYDAGELSSGEPYIFMELLRGEPLRARIDRYGRLPFEEARALVGQAARGLASAHAAGIVHRDLKPDNLFVCEADPPFVKILDFGISKFAAIEGDLRLTREFEAMGTPLYMSPEQVAGSPVDARSDIYALSVVLYECVTGKLPFIANSVAALSVKILAGGAVRPSALAPELPSDLDDFLAHGMALDPSERFANMDAFARGLASVGRGLGAASGEGSLAPGGASRRQRSSRRVAVAWGACAVASSAVLGAALAWSLPNDRVVTAAQPIGPAHRLTMDFEVAPASLSLALPRPPSESDLPVLGAVGPPSRDGSPGPAGAARGSSKAAVDVNLADVSAGPVPEARTPRRIEPSSSRRSTPSFPSPDPRPSPARAHGLSEENPFEDGGAVP